MVDNLINNDNDKELVSNKEKDICGKKSEDPDVSGLRTRIENYCGR